MTIILDTCTLIWWTLDPEQLSLNAQKICQEMEREKNGKVASISLWEIAIKIKNKKLDLGLDIKTYVNLLSRLDSIKIIAIDEQLWLESVNLDWEHRDPCDRVIVALATQYQARLVTKDKIISNFYPLSIW